MRTDLFGWLVYATLWMSGLAVADAMQAAGILTSLWSMVLFGSVLGAILHGVQAKRSERLAQRAKDASGSAVRWGPCDGCPMTRSGPRSGPQLDPKGGPHAR